MKPVKLILATTIAFAAFAVNAQDTTKLTTPPPLFSRIRQRLKIKC